MLESIKSIITRIYKVAIRECRIMKSMPIYSFCLLIFPLLIVILFTTLLDKGVPEKLPIGVVDLDNTSTTRQMIRLLNTFQTSDVVGYYNNMNEARRAVQRNQIYAFLYIPEGMTRDLLANRQPKVTYYCNNSVFLAGSMNFRDLKTICTLTAAGVGKAKLSALGQTGKEITANLQPIKLDMHLLNNPYSNYNIYLSTFIVPGLLLLFVFILIPYSIWTEVKFNRSREWLRVAGGSVHIALIGKLLPITVMFITVLLGFEFYIYGFLDFPHPGGFWPIVLIGLLSIFACQGFSIFVASLIPSLRMSMSVCTLWSVLSFSLCGATFPVTAMHPMIHALSALFPLRHYLAFYQICIFNGYPLNYAAIHIGALLLFASLPVLTMSRLKKDLENPVYIP